MKDMKIDFPAYILHALHVLHGEIKYSMLKFMTLSYDHQNGQTKCGKNRELNYPFASCYCLKAAGGTIQEYKKNGSCCVLGSYNGRG